MPGSAQPGTRPINHVVAERLRDMAALLSQQDANPFRINAYRRAAETLDALDVDVAALLEENGEHGLTELPSIGRGLASSIAEIVRTGRLSQLDRLRGEIEPERSLQRVPGIGPVLARSIHERLHIDTLEALEAAAHDGRLERLPGIGPRRVAAIRAGVAGVLGRPRPRRRPAGAEPPAVTLLEIDSEYRRKAAQGVLPVIAPRRFNPEGKAWLPVLHANRPPWHFTALFSNTAKAHQLERTRDWVVIYYYGDDHAEGQCTVVTETHGPLRGRRVVRGKESECAAAYAAGGNDRSVS